MLEDAVANRRYSDVKLAYRSLLRSSTVCISPLSFPQRMTAGSRHLRGAVPYQAMYDMQTCDIACSVALHTAYRRTSPCSNRANVQYTKHDAIHSTNILLENHSCRTICTAYALSTAHLPKRENKRRALFSRFLSASVYRTVRMIRAEFWESKDASSAFFFP